MKIIRSYARKISHEYYGGFKFETSDVFAAYEEEVPTGLGDKKFKDKSDELFKKAKADVEEEVEKIKAEIKQSKNKDNVQF